MINITTTTPDGIGGYLITSDDGWATGIASQYAPAATGPVGFLSFCLEYNEHFYPDRSYQFGLSTSAVHGGEVTSDPLSVGSGFLYSLFAKGNLPGTPELIQRTIWYLEDEQANNPGVYDMLLTSKFGSVELAKQDFIAGESAATYNVQVINVGSYPDYAGQDMMVYGAPETSGIIAGTVLAVLVMITLWRNK